MKTIEQRADEYIGHSFDIDESSSITAQRFAFIAGAKSEHEKLTRWHDPKEELPEEGRLVLLKTTFGQGYQLAEHEETGWWRPYDDEWEISDDQVIGWREIHE